MFTNFDEIIHYFHNYGFSTPTNSLSEVPDDDASASGRHGASGGDGSQL